jgi:hypothetical protein
MLRRKRDSDDRAKYYKSGMGGGRRERNYTVKTVPPVVSYAILEI